MGNRNENKLHFLYYIENKINGQLYIGISYNPMKRWKSHLSCARNKALLYVQRAIAKYGENNFIFNVYEIANTKTEAELKEIYWISEMRRLGIHIYNISDGGEGNKGHSMSLGQRQAASKRMKGKFAGDKNPFYGKNHTNETRQFLSKLKKEIYKNPSNRGEGSNNNKLTNEKILLIRKLYSSENYSKNRLSQMFKTSRANIKRIVNGTAWNHLPYDDFYNKKTILKLSPEIICEIRIKYASNKFSKKELAKTFNVSTSTILRIVNNITYKSIINENVLSKSNKIRIDNEICNYARPTRKIQIEQNILNNIIVDYNNGLSATAISKKYNYDKRIIIRSLKENKVEYRAHQILTKSDAILIREKYSQGISRKELSEEYKCK